MDAKFFDFERNPLSGLCFTGSQNFPKGVRIMKNRLALFLSSLLFVIISYSLGLYLHNDKIKYSGVSISAILYGYLCLVTGDVILYGGSYKSIFLSRFFGILFIAIGMFGILVILFLA